MMPEKKNLKPVPKPQPNAQPAGGSGTVPAPGSVLDGHNAPGKDGLTLNGKQGITIRNVTFRNWGGRAIFLANCRQVVIEGCTFEANGRHAAPGDLNGVTPGVLCVNCQDVTIKNCTFKGSGGKQIYFAQSSDKCRVQNCVIDGQGISLIGIQINAEEATPGTVRTGDPNHDQISNDCEISGNIITGHTQDGINFAIVRNSQIINNLIYNNGPMGVSLWNDGIGGPAWGCRNVLVAFNTILEPGAKRGALNLDGTGSGNIVSSNVLVGGLKNNGEQIKSEANLLSGDPKLGQNHRPLPGSPLIAAGKPVSGISQDMTGKARPSKPSIGALEP